MKTNLKKPLIAFCLIAVCFVGMGQSCRSFCLEEFRNCGGTRDMCEDAARSEFAPGAQLKAALAQCRTDYEECVNFCKSFGDDGGGGQQ